MKIYHLTPSGKLWIMDQKEYQSRAKAEAVFQKKSQPGDVLKIDIPGKDTIKIYKILNINPMGPTKSQLKMHVEDQKREEEKKLKEKQDKYNENAKKFFEEYTALTDKYGIFLNAQLEFSVDGVRPKIVVQIKPTPTSSTPTTATPQQDQAKK